MFRNLSFYLLLFPTLLTAQHFGADSLLVVKIEDRLSRAADFYKSNLDSALIVLNEVDKMVVDVEDANLQAKVLLARSQFLLYKREYATITELLSPVVANSKNIDPLLLGRTYKHIGHAYKQKWQPDSALTNYINALRIFQKLENNREISLTYLALGLVYSKLGNEALKNDFYEKSLKFSENSEIMERHKQLIPDADNKLPYSRSIGFSEDIAKIAMAQGNDRLLVVAYSDLKDDYFDTGQWDKALEYAEKEMRVRKRTNFNSTIPNTQHLMGRIYALKGDSNRALEYFNLAKENATDSLKLSIYQDMKDSYIKLGDSKSALTAMEAFSLLKDSIHARNTEASIAQITAQYRTDIQEQKIKTLSVENELKASQISRQRTLIIAGVTGGLIFLFLGLWGYRNYRSTQELKSSQLQFKLLQTQLNPHFIFNALNSIKLNLNSEQLKTSAEQLGSYSGIMRSILKGSTTDFITLKEDMEFLGEYLKLQQMVHEYRFSYKITCSDDLPVHYLQMPPMLTQPFVENAIIHGVASISEGIITLDYEAEDEFVLLRISDNGKGFSEEKRDAGNKLHESMGTRIIDERISNYKKLYNFEITQKIQSDSRKGTKVILKFPYRAIQR
jgi:tetratricopeptide (TPR) repeat protein